MPRTKEFPRIRIKTTITVPEDWKPLIDEYIREHGYKSFADMVRDWILEKIIKEKRRGGG